MKSLKLLLASLLVVGSLQAYEARQNRDAAVVAGVIGGAILVSVLASQHHSRPRYVTYEKHSHYRPYYGKKHYKKERVCYCRDEYRYPHHKRERDHHWHDERRR